MKQAATSFVLATLMACSVLPSSALADVQMVKTQAPAYCRVMVGDFEVTAISEGTVRLSMLELLTNAKSEKFSVGQIAL